MSFCRKCGAKLLEGDLFCTSCGAKIAIPTTETVSPNPNTDKDNTVNKKIESPTEQSSSNNNAKVAKNGKNNTTQETSINQVNIKGGRYVGRKWFIKLAYKMYETDVDFYNTFMSCKQGTGFSKAGTKIQTDFKYEDIYAIDAKKKYSIPNIIFAVIVAIMAFAMQVWAALIISLIVFFIGKTAVVVIHNSRGTYEIPTEFMSDAEELRNKIIAAQNQALRK